MVLVKGDSDNKHSDRFRNFALALPPVFEIVCFCLRIFFGLSLGNCFVVGCSCGRGDGIKLVGSLENINFNSKLDYSDATDNGD